MPDPANVFDGAPAPAATPPVVPAAATPPANSLEDLLKNIKNENGEQKYKSLEDALVALDHSQKYIPELKTQLTGTVEELNRVKEQMSKFENIEETVQRLLAQQQKPQAPTSPVNSGLDEQAVMKLVQESLQLSKQTEAMDSNLKQVNDALVGKFGEKAIDTLEAKAKELNTTRQALGELAKSNPKLVLALFETHPEKPPSPTMPSRRTPDPVNQQPTMPTRSMLSGVSVRDQAAYMSKIRDGVYTKHGIDK